MEVMNDKKQDILELDAALVVIQKRSIVAIIDFIGVNSFNDLPFVHRKILTQLPTDYGNQ